MTKLIAVIAAGLVAASATTFAGSHGQCNKQVANEHEKMACQVSMANLNLTPDQKTKMGAVMAEHEKAGCNRASEAKYMQEAKGILDKDQYAKFQTEMKHQDKTQT